jgi:hypothetical protein
MTFEAFDAALPIETAGFSPGLAMLPEAPTNAADTLDAALREIGRGPEVETATRAEMLLDRAALRAEAGILDLWVHGRGGLNVQALDRPGPGLWADTSWRAWALQSEDDAAPADGHARAGKELVLHANLDKPPPKPDPKEEDNEVVVKGSRPKTVDDEGGLDGVPSGDPGGADPAAPGVSPPIARDTPCVEASPSDVSLQELNNKALAASMDIVRLGKEDVYEYGVIIYLQDGVLHRTTVFGDERPGQINWNLGIPLLPNGVIIVATVHNHPDIGGINDGIPSYNNIMTGTRGSDWDSYSSFLSLNTRGITTDPKMIMYIYTNEDSKTRPYDNTDRNTTQKSCSLQ